MGDLNSQIQLFRSTRLFDKSLNMQLALGATIPISAGVRNEENDNRNLTSGTVDPTFRFVAVWNLYFDWSLIGSFFTRQIVATSSDGFRAADAYRYQLGLTFAPVGGSFDLNAQLRYFTRGRDIVSDVPFAKSGGDWTYVAFGGSKALFGGGETAVRFWGELEAPIVQNVNGDQLTGEWTIRAGFNFNLALFSHNEKPDHLHKGEGKTLLPTKNPSKK